jgi:hypothetical protein
LEYVISECVYMLMGSNWPSSISSTGDQLMQLLWDPDKLIT